MSEGTVRLVAGRKIIVIGCSVGAVEALQRLVVQLPEDFPAALFVVLHVSPQGTSVLPSILTRAGSLPGGFRRAMLSNANSAAGKRFVDDPEKLF